MVILSKKKFVLGAGDTRFVTKGGMQLEDAPDWIVKDPLYKLALADGDIIVTKSEAAEPEKPTSKKGAASK